MEENNLENAQALFKEGIEYLQQENYEIAEISGAIPWEILCGFKNRLPRVVI